LPRPPLGKPQITEMVGFEVTPDFARLVKEARERMNLTQEELGQKVGERTSTISLLERGKLKPSIPMARKLERALKIVLLIPAEEGPE
jgi:putative transcription factor